MIGYLIIPVALVVGFIFFRKSTHKILLSIALATVAGGAYRLYDMMRTDQAITTAVLAFAGLGVIWLVAWLANRSLTKKPTARLAAKTRGGPPRVDLR